MASTVVPERERVAGVAGQLLKLQLLLLIWRKTRLYSEEMKKNIHIPGHSRDKKVFIGFSPPLSTV